MKRACSIVVACALLISAGANAQQEPTLEQLFKRLSASEYDQREAATRDLMLREKLPERELAQALRDAKSPEQTQRLIRIAMHRFFASIEPEGGLADNDLGALGVSFPDVQFAADRYVVRPSQYPALETPAMLITHTYPGFPAFVHLQAGDLIVSINGKAFSPDLSNQEFGDRIKGYKAGDPMRMDLIRDGRRISVKLALGSYGRLDRLSNLMRRMGGITPEMYVPWRIKLRELKGEAAGVIRLGAGAGTLME